MSRRTRERPTVPVGTRVLVPFPWHKMDAVVVEHRGFLGVGGREMVRVQPLDPSDDGGAFDVPADEIEVSTGAADPAVAGLVSPRRRGGRARELAPAHLPVGAHVRVQLPNSTLDMEVVEDGGIVEGRQVVRVRTLDGGYIQADLQVSAGDVEVLSLPKARRGRAAA